MTLNSGDQPEWPQVVHGAFITKVLFPPHNRYLVQGGGEDGIVGVVYAHARASSHKDALQVAFMLDIAVAIEIWADVERVASISKLSHAQWPISIHVYHQRGHGLLSAVLEMLAQICQRARSAKGIDQELIRIDRYT